MLSVRGVRFRDYVTECEDVTDDIVWFMLHTKIEILRPPVLTIYNSKHPFLPSFNHEKTFVGPFQNIFMLSPLKLYLLIAVIESKTVEIPNVSGYSLSSFVFWTFLLCHIRITVIYIVYQLFTSPKWISSLIYFMVIVCQLL